MSDAFGQYLKKLRENKGMSVQELSDEVHYTTNYIHVMEGGKKGMPSLATISNLSKALDVPFKEMVAKAEQCRQERASSHTTIAEKAEAVKPMTKEELGMFIRLKRIDKRFTLKELSKITGVSDSYLSQFELGKTKNPPTVPLLRRLATIYEIPVDDLLVMASNIINYTGTIQQHNMVKPLIMPGEIVPIHQTVVEKGMDARWLWLLVPLTVILTLQIIQMFGK